MIELSKADKSLLLYLALHGPSVGNRMKPEVKNASRTAKRLKREGMIEGECIGIHPRPAEILSLTISGLSHVLTLIRSEERNLVMGRWAHLIPIIPLVSGKWNFFIHAGVEDLALKKFTAVLELEEQIPGIQFTPYSMNSDHPMDFAEKIQHYFYHPEIGLDDRKERLIWTRACARDEKVRDYFIKKLTLIIAQHEALLKEDKTMLQILQKS